MTEKPPRRASRSAVRASLALLLVLAALAAGHTLLWRGMGNRLEAGFAAWAQTRRAQGWRIEHGLPARGGWPFAATLALPGFRLAGGATLPGGIDWQAEAVVLRVALPRINRLVVDLRGPQRLRLGFGEPIPFAADRLEVLLPLEAGVLPREAYLAAEHLRIRAPSGGGGAIEVEAAHGHLETRISATEAEPAVLLALTAEGIVLPPGVVPKAGGLPRRAESLSGEAVLTGPIPPGRDPARRADAWREGGGTLELRALALRWGPVGATIGATITLDEALQPMGAGTVRLTGAGAALDALAAGGAVSPRAAASAKTVLALLARPPAEGGPPEVEVPLTLEDRLLTVARIPVARLAPLAWPARQGEAVEAPR
jgi:hypothetical protein